jgi:MurNAc alpha-1-phosphate uridylyltransferase
MIMAAGLGTRMRPLTETMPKPLVQVVGKPLIDYALDFLSASGISEIVVNSHYFAEILEEHLQSHHLAKKITISREDEVLETGGGIKKALPILGNSPFFVLNADVICIDGAPPALAHLAQNFDTEKMDAILLLHEVEKAVGYSGKGDFFINDNGTLRRRAENETAPYVFTGIQIIHPRLFVGAPDGKFSLNELYNRDLNRIGAIIHAGDWLHVGSPSELAEAENYLSTKF